MTLPERVLHFCCTRCGQPCEADLFEERAGLSRCPTCKREICLPDPLDYALSDGDVDRIKIVRFPAR